MITDDNQGGSANVSPRVDFAHSKPRKKVPAYISSYTVFVVLRHKQRYFSYIGDGTDVQMDWRRNLIIGWGKTTI